MNPGAFETSIVVPQNIKNKIIIDMITVIVCMYVKYE